MPRIKIDNLIDGYFIHHHYDDNEEPITIKSERKSKNILSIIRENWKKRLQRFNKENIVFIFSDDTRVTNDDLMKFVNVKTPYKKILLSNKDFSKYNCDNFLYVKMIPFVHDIDNMIAKKEVSEFIGEIL